jgi:hypothetical protein
MQAIKRTILVATILANLTLLAEPAGPASPPASLLATNRPLYTTEVKRVGGPGLIPADFAYVTFGTTKFGFVMPAGYRVETQDGQKVTLVSADFNCLLTFRVVEPLQPGATELDPALYRDLVLNRRHGGKIVDEFTQAAVSRRGPAFDLRWTATGSVPRRERVLFIPSNAGVLEFSLVSSLEKFEMGQKGFNALLITFRAAGPDGRLEMPMLSDRF